MTNTKPSTEERASLFPSLFLSADSIDYDLGPNAERIQLSITSVWQFDSRDRPWALLALSWGYWDSENYYAHAEAEFLWSLSMKMWGECPATPNQTQHISSRVIL